MQEKIKIGEYVRNEDGYIGVLVDDNQNVLNHLKIDVGREIQRDNGISDHYIYTRYGFKLKHSKNLIDLIKPGELIETEYGSGWFHHKIDEKTFLFDDGEEFIEAKNEHLISILTHEQYEANCYKVGGKDA